VHVAFNVPHWGFIDSGRRIKTDAVLENRSGPIVPGPLTGHHELQRDSEECLTWQQNLVLTASPHMVRFSSSSLRVSPRTFFPTSR